MKKFFIVIFLLLIININNVKAQDISIDNVIDYMNANNILDDKEYFYLFGDILNINEDYNIIKLTYNVRKENNNINITLNLEDQNLGLITKNINLNIENNLIIYTNNYDINSLESRLGTIIFNELIYAVGIAREYNKDLIINWMNQIDLNKITIDKGLKFDYEVITKTIKKDNNTFNYEICIPKYFAVDINKLTDNIPDNIEVELKPLSVDSNTVKIQVLAKSHLDKMCVIYRKNGNEYEKVGKVSCNKGEFTDYDLKEKTTYHYEAIIEDLIMCPNIIDITTTDVPPTGKSAIISIGGIILLISLIIIFNIHHKNKMYKI